MKNSINFANTCLKVVDTRRFPLGKHFQLDPYYEHENNTGKKPNQQVNAAGLILNTYF